jgi:hypothetical protein
VSDRLRFCLLLALALVLLAIAHVATLETAPFHAETAVDGISSARQLGGLEQ